MNNHTRRKGVCLVTSAATAPTISGTLTPIPPIPPSAIGGGSTIDFRAIPPADTTSVFAAGTAVAIAPWGSALPTTVFPLLLFETLVTFSTTATAAYPELSTDAPIPNGTQITTTLYIGGMPSSPVVSATLNNTSTSILGISEAAGTGAVVIPAGSVVTAIVTVTGPSFTLAAGQTLSFTVRLRSV